MSEFNLPKFYAQIPEKLVNAQHLLEQTIEAYGDASNAEAEATMEYRKKKAEVIMEYQKAKVPATLILELARGVTCDLKMKLLQATGNKNKLRALIEGYRERIFTLRHIGKGTEAMK